MLNFQFHILSNALATAETQGPEEGFGFEEPNIEPAKLQKALVLIFEHCGAKISPDMTVDITAQKECYSKYLQQFYEYDSNLTKEILIKSHPESQLTNPTINDVLRLMKDTILIPEIIEAFRNLVDAKVYDLPLGLDSPIDAKTWSIASHFYLAAIKEDFKQLFVNYPEDLTLRTWEELGLTEEFVAVHEASTGTKIAHKLTDSITLEEFLKFKIEYTSTYQGSEVIRIEDFTKVSQSWDMPILFFGAILDKSTEWFPPGEVPELLMEISQTLNDHYTHLLENLKQEEAAMSHGDADESEQDDVETEIPVEAASELDAEVDAVL